MKKERETANKYRQQALEGDLMAMNNMGVCYAQGIGGGSCDGISVVHEGC